MLDDLLRLAGVAARVETGAALLRPTDISLARGDAALAASLLGWTPRRAWEDTLSDVLADWAARVAAGDAPDKA